MGDQARKEWKVVDVRTMVDREATTKERTSERLKSTSTRCRQVLGDEKNDPRRRDYGQGLVGKQMFSHLESYQQKAVRDIVLQFEREGVVSRPSRPFRNCIGRS